MVWDERYQANPEAYGSEPSSFLVDMADCIPPGSDVVVPGDGYGRNGLWLARRGHHVISVELSQIGLQRIREIADRDGLNVDTVYADLGEWEPPACDAVVLFSVHLLPSAREHMHAVLWQSLRPGGIVILQAFTPKQRSLGRISGGPRNPEMTYTLEQLKGDFAGADFQIMEEKTIEILEGTLHTGPAEIVRMVAIKPGEFV